jgi:hypothetical protein
MEKKSYKCGVCGKKLEKFDDEIPICCGKPMRNLPLDVCVQPSDAEHARPMDDEEPCDDGRAG